MHRPIGPIGVQDIGNHIDVISSVFISGCKCFFSCKNSQKLGFGVRVNVSVMVSCRSVVPVTIDQHRRCINSLHSSTFGSMPATFSKLTSYCVLRPTQLPTLGGTWTEMSAVKGEGLVWPIWWRFFACRVAHRYNCPLTLAVNR